MYRWKMPHIIGKLVRKDRMLVLRNIALNGEDKGMRCSHFGGQSECHIPI